jgi:hypothetical protein
MHDRSPKAGAAGSTLSLGSGRTPGADSKIAIALSGERLAVTSTAVAVAMLPLLVPRAGANVTPADGFIAIALFSALISAAGSSRLRLQAPYVLPVGLMVAGGAAGALSGPVPIDGLLAVIQDLWLLAWAICIANVCRTPGALKIVVRTWAYAAIAWASLLLIGELAGISYLAGTHSNLGGRTTITFGDPNIAAHYFLVSILLIAATRCPRQLLVRVFGILLLLVAWALTGSNGGIVALLIGIVLIAVVNIYRRSGAVPAIAAACCVAAIGSVALPAIPLAHIQQSAHDSKYRVIRDWVGHSQRTVFQREELFHEGIGLYYAGGPLGEGPHSTIARLRDRQAVFAREAHNDYVASLNERGALGAIGIMLLVAGVSARTWSVVRRSLSGAFAEVVPRHAVLIAAVAATFILATVYEVLHVRHVWALFGLIAALHYWGRE